VPVSHDHPIVVPPRRQSTEPSDESSRSANQRRFAFGRKAASSGGGDLPPPGRSVRAQTKRGRTIYDPSPAQLGELLRRLDQVDRFLVIECLDARVGTFYAQVLLTRDQRWAMEYRDGDGQHHFQALTNDRAEAAQFLALWLLRLPGFRGGHAWRTLLS
jgi:hypothetical protein